MNGRGDDGRGDDASSDSSKNVVAIDRPPLIAVWWSAQMILSIVNWLAPPPILRFHVVTLPPFIMANVGVMMSVGFMVRVGVVMIVGTVLRKRHRPYEACA